MEMLLGLLFSFLLLAFGFAAFVLLISIKQVNEYDRGVKFQFGKYKTVIDPGWRLVFPVIQGWRRVDMRVRVVDVPHQEAITKDNVSVVVNAVLYYRVADAKAAVIAVESFFNAISQLAQTTMRNVVGEVDLDELLSERERLSERIRLIVDKASDAWGIKVDSVELKEIVLPEEMKRVIARQAEAEREKRAVIIKAEGEVIAADNMAKAASILSKEAGALHLRTLQTLNDVSSDQSNTIIFATPIEVLRALEGLGKIAKMG
ncbi:MAG: slipin family protein [Actinobacteria bacterium]|nr:MAG: slipin family protein [Actinomycetota bacterium]